MRYLAIDPGRKGLGWALFSGPGAEGFRLVAAGVIAQPPRPREYTQPDLGAVCVHMSHELRKELRAHGIGLALVERMRHYPNGLAADAKANDLLDLQAIGAFVAGSIGAEAVRFVTPQEWGGSVPKAIKNKRVLEALDAAELRCIQGAGARTHNALDAIGIGLNYVGRFGK